MHQSNFQLDQCKTHANASSSTLTKSQIRAFWTFVKFLFAKPFRLEFIWIGIVFWIPISIRQEEKRQRKWLKSSKVHNSNCNVRLTSANQRLEFVRQSLVQWRLVQFGYWFLASYNVLCTLLPMKMLVDVYELLRG